MYEKSGKFDTCRIPRKLGFQEKRLSNLSSDSGERITCFGRMEEMRERLRDRSSDSGVRMRFFLAKRGSEGRRGCSQPSPFSLVFYFRGGVKKEEMEIDETAPDVFYNKNTARGFYSSEEDTNPLRSVHRESCVH